MLAHGLFTFISISCCKNTRKTLLLCL
jgi:hypothetical protein